MTGLVPLHERREALGDKLFNSIMCNPSHELYRLLSSKNKCEVNLRSKRTFTSQRPHNIRTGNSFIRNYFIK